MTKEDAEAIHILRGVISNEVKVLVKMSVACGLLSKSVDIIKSDNLAALSVREVNSHLKEVSDLMKLMEQKLEKHATFLKEIDILRVK